MDTISLDAAVAITGISRSTLWRRVTDGSIGKGGKDARNRALLALADVLPLAGAAGVALDAEDVQMLVRADRGDAAAQADVGALFALATLDARNGGKPRGGGGSFIPAMYFLTQAAEQGQADAMHWLGMLHAAGLGEGDGPALALMWIAKAAAHGHVIARQQLEGLLPDGQK